MGLHFTQCYLYPLYFVSASVNCSLALLFGCCLKVIRPRILQKMPSTLFLQYKVQVDLCKKVEVPIYYLDTILRSISRGISNFVKMGLGQASRSNHQFEIFFVNHLLFCMIQIPNIFS